MVSLLAVNTEAAVDLARTLASLSNAVTYLAGVLVYVLLSWGLYAIAKRRGVRKPWLAWVPIGNMWVLGCIADQYRLHARKQKTNRRKTLLIINGIVALLALILVISMLVAAVNIIDRAPSVTLTNEQMTQLQNLEGDERSEAFLKLMIQSLTADASLVDYAFSQLIGVGVLALLLGIANIAATVVKYVALNDLFASCDPGRRLMFLLLSIFVYGAASVLVFLCKNKDQGMPN